MLLTDTNVQFQQFLDFHKYARFISAEFNIEVQLDSNKAETDGKVIYLPNVLSMTEKELDMMYAILLHEAGHIRYSTFDESYFSQLRSEHHAFLANSIEDARIENLLLVDFGGAQEILESLYNDYLHDKNLMKKVFKFESSRPDAFSSLAFLIHNEIVNFKTPELKEISGSSMANKIIAFYQEHKIADLISAKPLKNDSDVLSLTNKIYDLFVKHFMKDKSTTIDFKNETKEKNKLETIFDKIKADAFAAQEKINAHKEAIDAVNQEKQEFYANNAFLIEDKENEITAKESQKADLDSVIGWKRFIADQNHNKEKIQSNIKSLLSKNEELAKEIQQINEQLSSGLNAKGKPFTEKQTERNNNQIVQKTESIKKNTDKITSEQEKLSSIEKIIQETHAPEFTEFDVNAHIDDLVQQQEKFSTEIESLEGELKELHEKGSKFDAQISALNTKIESIENNLAEQTAKQLFDVSKTAANFDIQVLPPINYDGAWPEATSVQESWDKKATEEKGVIVCNGSRVAGLFGSNVRDIVTFVDKQKEKVVDIDLSTVFKEKLGTSKLSEFNSEIKKSNYEDKSITGVFGTHREHIPSTTVFDTIKNENTSTQVNELNKIRKDNVEFFLNLKRTVAKKFKFAKKDFWRGSQEDGQLDSRSLWKLPTKQGDDFYEVNNPKFVNKLAVSILIDISGSQDKEATGFGEKIKSLALGLSDAFDEAHIKHEVLGYHAPVCEAMRSLNSSSIYTRRSNNLETIVYKTASQKDKLGLMNIDFFPTDNSDGESLRIAIKRLKAIRAKSHAIFIITDGKPFLSDTDMSVLDEDFRSALRQCVREKVQVFGLGFFDQLGEFLGERFCNSSDSKNVLDFLNKINI